LRFATEDAASSIPRVRPATGGLAAIASENQDREQSSATTGQCRRADDDIGAEAREEKEEKTADHEVRPENESRGQSARRVMDAARCEEGQLAREFDIEIVEMPPTTRRSTRPRHRVCC